MKHNRSNSFLFLLVRRLLSGSAIVLSFFGMARAAQIGWSGTTNTTWATGTNWAGTAPANSITTDTALFNLTTYPNQPNAGTTSIAGIQIGDGTTATAPLTLSGTQLTIGATGINMMANASAATVTSPVTLGAAQTWTVGGSATLGVSGTISGGAFALTKIGTGTLNFSGTFSNTPNIFLTSASSAASSAGVLAGANITATNLYLFQNSVTNGTVNYSQTGGTVTTSGEFGLGGSSSGGDTNCVNNATISGGTVTAGTLYLYKWATSTLTISNSGVVNATSLRIGWVDSSPVGTINVGDGTSFSGGTNITNGGTSGVLNVTGWNIQSNRNYALNFKGGTLKSGAASTSWLAAGAFTTAAVQDAGGIIDNGGFAVTIGQAFQHGGTNATDGGLVFKGTGTTTLIGANTYNGSTTVAAGTLTLLEGVSNSGTLAVNNGATLGINGSTGAVTTTTNLTIGSTPTAGGATLLFNNFASNAGVALASATTLTTKAAASGAVINLAGGNFTATGTYPLITYTGTIAGDGFGALSLTKPRSVVASLVNDTANTRVALNITAINPSVWSGNLSAVWDVNTTANWTVNAVSDVFKNLDIVTFDDTASGSGPVGVTLNSTATTSSISVANPTRDYTISGTGAIAGTGGIVKTGAGTLTLSTSNTFSGASTLSAGVIKIGNANALGATGTASGTTVASGAVLDLNGIAMAAESLTLNGTGISSGGVLINSSATAASTAGLITLASNAAIGGTGNMTLSGAISGTSSLTKSGVGTTTLTGASTFSGGLTANAGTLVFGSGGSINNVTGITVNSGATVQFSGGTNTNPIGSANMPVTVNAGGTLAVTTANSMGYSAQGNYANLTMTGGTLALSAAQYFNTVVLSGSSVTGSGALQFWYPVTTAISAPTTSTISAPIAFSNSTQTISTDAGATLTVSGVVSGNGFTKIGDGSLVLTNANTYTGTTYLTAGTLTLPVSQSSTSFIVSDGTALNLRGAPGSSFSVSGLSIGSYATSALSINNFGSNLTAATAPIKASSGFTAYGTVSLSVSGNFTGTGTFPLISYPTYGYTYGSLDALSLSLPPNVTGVLQDNPANLTIDLAISAVNPLVWKGGLSGGLWDVNNTANWFTSALVTDGKYQEGMIVQLDDTATGSTSIVLNTVISPSSVTALNSSKNYTITGTGGFTGGTSLTKLGTGTLTLATANDYSGATTITAGSLSLGDGTTNGSLFGPVNDAADFTINNGSAQSFSNLITGTGTFTKKGTGTLTLLATNNYTGTTTISGGSVVVGNGLTGSLGTGPVVDNANLTYYRTDSTQVTMPNTVSGTGTVSYTGPSGAAALTAQYLIASPNSYSGGTTVSNSRANFTDPLAFGTGTVTVTSGGGLLTSTPITVANPIVINGLGWLESAGQLGAVRLTGGTVLTGGVTLASASRISVYGGSGKIGSVISGSFPLEITGQGISNALTLSGSTSNTFTGGLTITSGQVVQAKTGGAYATPGDITLVNNADTASTWMSSDNQLSGTGLLSFSGVNSHSRFQLTGTSQTVTGLSNAGASGHGVVQNSETTTYGAVNYGTGTLVLNVSGNYLFDAYVRGQTGTLGLVKNGTGTQTLSGANITYNGTTTVNAGTMKFTSTSALATSISNSATVEINSVAGDDWVDSSKTLSGNGTWNKTGAGRASFANCIVTASGQFNIQAGTLRNNSNASDWSASTANIDVSSGAILDLYADAIYLNKLTGSGVVQSSYGNLTGQSGLLASYEKLVVGVANGTATFSGVLRNNTANTALGSGVEAGGLQFEKVGTGTQTLSGVNIYTGQTFVRGGTLALGAGGTINTSSAVTVSSGAVLDVSASSFTQASASQILNAGHTSGSANDIVGSVTTGGIVNVAGGNNPATLAISGNLSLSGGGNLQLDISGNPASGNDLIASGGNLSLSGTTTVTPFFNGTPSTSAPYTIATYSGTLTGNASNLSSGLGSSRYSLAFDTTTTPGSVLMNVSGTGKSLVWSGAAAGVWVADTTTLNWNTGADYFGNLDSVTFNDTDANGTVTLSSAVAPASITVSASTTAYTVSGAGAITGGGSLTKSGTAALTLATTGTSNYSGGVTVNGGTLNVGSGANENASALGSGLATVNSGATLSFKPGSSSTIFSFQNSFAVNGGTISSEDGIQRLATGSGATFNVGASGGTVQSTWSGKDVYIDGAVTGSGALTISHGPTAGSAATVHIGNAASTYSGTVSVSGAGTGASLSLDSNVALQSATVNLNPGTAGTLILGQQGVTTLSGLSGSAGTIKPSGAGDYTLNLNLASSSVYGGTIANNTGILGLTKNGAGSLTLGGANTFSGVTRLMAGTTLLTNSLALSGSTLDWNSNGGTLDFGTLTAVTLGALQGSQNLSLINSSSGAVALTIGNTATSNTTTYTGVLSGTGGSLTKAGLGNLTLGGSGSNTFTGNLTVNTTSANGTTQGSLYLAKTGGAIAVPANTTVFFGTGTTGQANIKTMYDNQFGSGVVMNFGNASGNWDRLDLVGTSQSLAGIITGNISTAGGGIVQNAGLDGYSLNSATLTLTGNSTDSFYPVGGYIFNGYIRDTDAGVNAARQINIVKTGTSTQTLVGANVAYTGTTTVSSGTLVLRDTTGWGSSIVNNATVDWDTVAGFSRGGNITLTGNGTYIKTGAGTFGMGGSSSGVKVALGSSALIDIQAGMLRNEFGSFNDWTSNQSSMNVASGATFDLWDCNTAVIDKLTGAGTIVKASTSSGGTALGNLIVGVANGSSTYSGLINNGSSALGITKNGTGTLTLTGPLVSGVPTSASTFSGNITINGGKLVGAALRTGSNGVFGAASNSRTITVNAGTTIEFDAPNTFGNHNNTTSPTLVVNGGTVTNADPLSTGKNNNGLRNVTLNNGTLTSTTGNSVPANDISPSRPGEDYGAWGINGTLTSTGTSQITTTDTSHSAGRVLLSSTGSDSVFAVNDGRLTVGVMLQGGDGDTGGLNKTGAGTLVLAATNIYRGPTTITNGTLELNGSLVKADGAAMTPSNITVTSAGKLTGTGLSNGTVYANGIVAPGNGIGTLSVGSTTFTYSGSLVEEINSSTNTADKLAITGDLTLDPNSVLTVTDLGTATPAAGTKFVLATYTGTWNGTPFSGMPDDGLITVGSNTYFLNYNDTVAGVHALTLTAGSAGVFEDWAAAYGLFGSDATRSADPDHDGVSNLLEFATASDPTDPNSRPRIYPLMHVIGGTNALTYTLAVRKNAVFAAATSPNASKQTANKDQLQYTIEASTDLATWNTLSVSEVTGADATAVKTALGALLTTPSLDSNWEWHTFRAASGAPTQPKAMIRLHVEETP